MPLWASVPSSVKQGFSAFWESARTSSSSTQRARASQKSLRMENLCMLQPQPSSDGQGTPERPPREQGQGPVQGRDAGKALEASGTRRSTPAPGPHPQLGSPQCIVCGARSPLLRDLLLSCKLGLFTPNKASDYPPGKRPIDGGGGWGAAGREAEEVGGGCWYRNQALPCRLVIHQQQWPSDLFAGNDLGGERREELREDWQEGKMLIRHRSQRAAPCQAKPPPV